MLSVPLWTWDSGRCISEVPGPSHKCAHRGPGPSHKCAHRGSGPFPQQAHIGPGTIPSAGSHRPWDHPLSRLTQAMESSPQHAHTGPGSIPSVCSQRLWGHPPQHAHRGTGLGEGMEYLRLSSLPQWPTISHQTNGSPLETLQTLQGSLGF